MTVFVTKASHCSLQGKWNNDLEKEEKMPHCKELVNKKRKRPSPVRIPVPNDLYKLRYRPRPSHAWNSNWDNTLDSLSGRNYIASFQLSIVTKLNDWNSSLLNLVLSIHNNLNQNWIDILIDSVTNNYDNSLQYIHILLYYHSSCFYQQNCDLFVISYVAC